MPDWDDTESRERDEDAAWRDLIARFDAPATAEGPAPWPEREDMSAASGAGGPDKGPGDDAAPDGVAPAGRESDGTEPAGTAPAGTEGAAGHNSGSGDPGGSSVRGAPGADRARGDGDGSGRAAPHEAGGAWGVRGSNDADRIWRALEAEGLLGETEPDVIQATRRLSRSPVGWVPVRGAPADDDEHFVPPVPPPLPKLDPLTKMAWAALFGGPGYLMLATALHWSVPGFAAFCAVAAFVTGFALLVLRMNEPGPDDPDDGDDGAVV